MSTRFTFLHGVEVKDTVRAYAEKKAEAAGKALDAPFDAEVTIERNKRAEYEVSVSVHACGETFRATDRSDRVEAAIDMIERELQEQIRDWKGKTIDLSRRRARSGKKNTVVDDSARF